MTKIGDLIKNMCPNGVTYKKLDTVCKIEKGKQLNKELLSEIGTYPVINGGISPSGYWDDYNFDENKITISQGGASAGYVNYITSKFWAGAHCYVVNSCNQELNYKYIYHFLKEKQKFLLSSQVGAGIPSISLKEINALKIPCPPLEIQNEIVKILDKFGELEAELEARESQYEFWSGKIFESHMNGETKHITDIALVKARVGWQRLTTAEYLNSGDYYLITGTDFTDDGKVDFNSCVYVTKERYDMDENIQIHKNDILITKDGTLGKIAYLDDEPDKLTTLNSGVFRIKINNEKVLPRYIYHYFNSKIFKDFVESVKTGSTIPHLTQEKLTNLNIPIPSVEEQAKIVNILDKFDSLIRNITIGLPAEIELRKQQYDYYRNKLFEFEEMSISE